MNPKLSNNKSDKFDAPIVKLLGMTFGLCRPGGIVKWTGWGETRRHDRWSMDILPPGPFSFQAPLGALPRDFRQGICHTQKKKLVKDV